MKTIPQKAILIPLIQLFLIILSLLISQSLIASQNRVALVIGNSNYQIAPLKIRGSIEFLPRRFAASPNLPQRVSETRRLLHTKPNPSEAPQDLAG